MWRIAISFCLIGFGINQAVGQNYQWAFKTNYDKVYDFYDGHAIVINGLKKGFINKKGTETVAPQYNIIDAYSEGLASAGLIDFQLMTSLSGYVSEDGQLQIPMNFEVTSPFKEGLACVKDDDIWGYINRAGQYVIEPEFDAAYSFNEGYAAVKKDDLWGIIDQNGSYLIAPTFEDALGFFEGLCCVKAGGKWGFVNKSGDWAIPAQYEYASSFQNGLARVKIDGKFGLIQPDGSFFIEPVYERLYNFNHERARFFRNGRWGFLNKQKQAIIPATYESAGDFSENLARVKVSGQWGYINVNGDMAIKPVFNEGFDFREGLARVEKDGKWGFILYSPSGAKEIISDQPKAVPDELTVRNIKPGKEISIPGDSITLEIYDHKKIDGDIVSLNFNGVWILRNFTLTREPFTIPLDLDPGIEKNYLMLYANNLGDEPPNTLAVRIKSGTWEQEEILDSDLNQCDILYLRNR